MADSTRRDSVFVVPVRDDIPSWATIPWIEFIERYHRYFHPVAGPNWPRQAVPWIGFRFRGELHSVHRVATHIVVPCRSELGKHFPEVDGEKCRLRYDNGQTVPHFIYTLADAQYPERRIKSGNVFGPGHLWIDRDLLLSCATVREAFDRTCERRSS